MEQSEGEVGRVIDAGGRKESKRKRMTKYKIETKRRVEKEQKDQEEKGEIKVTG